MIKFIKLLLKKTYLIITFTLIGIIIGYFLQLNIPNQYKSYLHYQHSIKNLNADIVVDVLSDPIRSKEYTLQKVPEGLNVIKTGTRSIITIDHESENIKNKEIYFDYLTNLFVNYCKSQITEFKSVNNDLQIKPSIVWTDLARISQIYILMNLTDEELEDYLRKNVKIVIEKKENTSKSRKFIIIFFTSLNFFLISIIYVLFKKELK